jgi:crotonobetainyl-CoA:carnitine CoA-transferase CaiB-like acyl-CoA transferase
MDSIGSLTNVKVLDLSRMLPGPFCSMILADHGAEVIAIEDRRFEKDGLFFQGINRNKKHMCLNLKTAEGKDIFLRLVRDSDVLIEGFRPGVVQRLGIDYESIRGLNPGIVYCSITGYGQTGPYRDRAGHDINYLGSAGILELIGPAEGPPSIPGIQIADIGGGSMQAVTGILLALLARHTSGRGQYIDISMTDGLLGYLSLAHHFSEQSQVPPKRSNDLLSHRYACYNTYETSDGRYVAVGALERRFWAELCHLLEVPELIDAQYDEARREELIHALRDCFKAKTSADLKEILAHENSCCSLVETLEETLAHPHFTARGMVHNYQDKEGCARKSFGIPIKLSETPGSIRSLPDSFGGSSEEILHDLGYTTSEISEFRGKGII